MAQRRRTPVHDSMLPVIAWISAQGNLTEAGFAKQLDISQGRFTNWKRRGVPPAEIPRLAEKIGKNTDDYLREIGRRAATLTGKQRSLEGQPYLEDFEALPDFLQTYIARKVVSLRTLWDGFPEWFRDKLAPPKDPNAYRAWERDIEALMTRFRPDDE